MYDYGVSVSLCFGFFVLKSYALEFSMILNEPLSALLFELLWVDSKH